MKRALHVNLARATVATLPPLLSRCCLDVETPLDHRNTNGAGLALGGNQSVEEPRSENEAGVDIVSDPEFDIQHGFCLKPFVLTITCATPGAVLRYTTDGRSPTAESTEYSAPLSIKRTTILRAKAFRTGWKPSAIRTATYIFLDDVQSQSRPPDYPAEWSRGTTGDYEIDPDVVNGAPFHDRSGAKFGLGDALLALPAVSIVMNPTDLFGARGLYRHLDERGSAWEKPASIEFIDPKGGPEFQVDCGIRVHGGYSRNPEYGKHSFRLYFRRTYGPNRLRFPLFPDSRVDSFDKLVLRAGSDDSWVTDYHQWMRPMAQYLRDQFARDIQRDMGRLSSHGRFVHLYLNGLYWGLYNCSERLDSDFLASYLGGTAKEYDVVKTGGEVQDGDRIAWDTMLEIAEAGLGTREAYGRILEYLDIDSFIDYMITNMFIANVDWPHNNWCAGRRRQPGAGFQFFCWDSEETLYHPPNSHVDINCDRTHVDDAGSPGQLYASLRENAEFRMRFADRVKLHFLHGGALTSEKVIARWMDRADRIDQAMVAESARWGDHHRKESPFTREEDWLSEQRHLIYHYFSVPSGRNRSEIVLDQFRSAGLYPEVEAPVFQLHGGQVEPGFELTVEAPGSRLAYFPLVAYGASCRVLVPNDDSLGLTWTAERFDDKAWTRGITGVGYEKSSGYENRIGTDLESRLAQPEQSVYIRIHFKVAFRDSIKGLRLKMLFDDGFVAYLNGRLAAHRHAPPSPAWNSTATQDHEADSFEVFEFGDEILEYLHSGQNVLAIQGLNLNNHESSDFLVLPELEAGRDAEAAGIRPAIHYTLDGSDPRLEGGSVAPTAKTYKEPITLKEDVTVTARVLNGGIWSALNRATFAVNPRN